MGKWRYSATHFILNFAQEGEKSASPPSHSNSRENNPHYPSARGWVGLISHMNAMEMWKISYLGHRLSQNSLDMEPIT
jgi:hypothetical protein